MMMSTKKVMAGAGWTSGGYIGAVILRFGSNIILSRLASPEIFGVMLIINTIRTSIELLSDVGIAQNVIHNKNGENPDFLNTAWTVQILRGVLLSLILFGASYPLSYFYEIPSEYIQFSAVITVLMSLQSTSVYVVQRRLDLKRLSVFDFAQDVVTAVTVIGCAYLSPTVPSLILASFLATLIRVVTSHIAFRTLVPHPNWFRLEWKFVSEIISLGKWIFLTSLTMLACDNFDRFYLGQIAPLSMLGVYGISITLAFIPGQLVNRLGRTLLFPLIASGQSLPRYELRSRISRMRIGLLGLTAAGIAVGINVSDLLVHFVYDSRYADAGWMVPILLAGMWFVILMSFNDNMVLGLGKAMYGTFANVLKLAYLVVFLPLAYSWYGMFGAVVVSSFSDLPRFAVAAWGTRRENISFLRQEAALTVMLVALTVVLMWLRWSLGWGTPFDHIPSELLTLKG